MSDDINRNRRPYGEGLEETALYIARTKPHFDDDVRPVRRHASPTSDREIRLAFAVLLELVDRIGEFAPGYCDAATATGRAFQAALFVSKAHCLKMTCLGVPETIAAGIVIEQIGKFIASRPARKWKRWDERSHLRNISALLSLGGMAACDIADKLGLDPSDLRRRLKNDVEEIEHRFGHFCKGNKALRRKWQLPEMPSRICYNADDRGSRDILAAAAILASVDPDFDDVPTDDLSKILSSALFD